MNTANLVFEHDNRERIPHAPDTFVIYALGPSGQLVNPDNPPQRIPDLVRNLILINRLVPGDIAAHIKSFVAGKRRKSRKSRKTRKSRKSRRRNKKI